jgi:hypothetical protein
MNATTTFALHGRLQTQSRPADLPSCFQTPLPPVPPPAEAEPSWMSTPARGAREQTSAAVHPAAPGSAQQALVEVTTFWPASLGPAYSRTIDSSTLLEPRAGGGGPAWGPGRRSEGGGGMRRGRMQGTATGHHDRGADGLAADQQGARAPQPQPPGWRSESTRSPHQVVAGDGDDDRRRVDARLAADKLRVGGLGGGDQGGGAAGGVDHEAGKHLELVGARAGVGAWARAGAGAEAGLGERPCGGMCQLGEALVGQRMRRASGLSAG